MSRFTLARRRAAVAAPFAIVALVLGLTACTPSASEDAAGAPAVVIGEDAVLIDVRTPEEFAEGHLIGAQLLDFNGGELAAAIPSLDPDAEYFVYCRSGNRSGQAMALMQQAGIDNVTNLGSRDQAADSTGLPTVQ